MFLYSANPQKKISWKYSAQILAEISSIPKSLTHSQNDYGVTILCTRLDPRLKFWYIKKGINTFILYTHS